MAIKRTVEIDIDTRDAIKSLDALGDTFEDVFEEAKPLTTQIGEMEDILYQMALAGDTASEEFQTLSKQVGDMRKVIIQTDQTVDGFSQTLAQSAGGALQGVASGFELATGAMGAFGASGEAVEQALLKVQSAMAVAQGLQGIRDSIASFQALRKAIMSTTVVQTALNFVMNLNPVGLIIAGVVALGAAIAALWNPVKDLLQWFGWVEEDAETVQEANDRLTESMERQEKQLDRISEVYDKMHDNRMRQLKLQDASEEEIHQATLDRLAEEEGIRAEQLNASEKNLKELREQYKQALINQEDDLAESIKEQAEQEADKIRQIKLMGQEFDLSRREEEKRYTEFLDNQNKERTEKEAAELKERQDKYKKYLEDRKAALERIQDLETDLIRDEEEKKLEARRLQFERELEDVIGNEEEKNAQRLLLEEQYQRDVEEIRVSFNNERLETIGLEQEQNLELLNNEIAQFAEAEQQKLDIAKETAEQQKQLEKDVQAAKLEQVTMGFQLAANIAELFANKSKRAARIAFNVQKAASISEATISGIQGTINAFTTAAKSPITSAFPAYPFIQAGLAGAFAATNIAKISSQQFQSSSAGGLGGGGSAVPSGGGTNVANFNVVGNTGVNQLAETLGQQNEQPIKTFVVASDVTTQQSLDRNTVETATL